MKIRDGWDGGKRKYITADSGVEHNPLPRTERGMRRRAKNHPNGIQSSHPAFDKNNPDKNVTVKPSDDAA